MQKILLAAVVAMMPGVATAEPSKPKKPANAQPAKACAEYGVGFVKVEGSSTCVKIGGYVRIEGGRSR